MIATVFCQDSSTFIGCQAWCDALQELLALRGVWLKQEAAVCCDDCPVKHAHVCKVCCVQRIATRVVTLLHAQTWFVVNLLTNVALATRG